MKVAIIGGTGKMGWWFANFLKKQGKEVLVIGRNEQKLREAKEQLGVETSDDLAAVKGADAVVISVTIDNFESVVKELKPHVQPGQIVLDVTSVKAAPVAAMHRHLASASVLGTHPLFGPGAKDLTNKNFVLTPTNDKETELADRVKKFLEKSGAKVAIMTPEEHDEMMSVVLGLSHFVGLVAAETLANFGKLKPMADIGGGSYKLLLTLAESVVSEDAEFYASLQMNMTGATKIEEMFRKNALLWADIVKNKNQAEFARKMTALKNTLEKADPNFRKAYENMYKIMD
ncbi:MAG: prephenate dehydrogenase [Dehalococcoidales bacterium]|nr:prephenate dehydrogenase [Dehalococcoidales bacterium]